MNCAPLVTVALHPRLPGFFEDEVVRLWALLDGQEDDR